MPRLKTCANCKRPVPTGAIRLTAEHPATGILYVRLCKPCERLILGDLTALLAC